MAAIKIAIIREEKLPRDTRTPITPSQAKDIIEKYPEVEIYCQSSDIRCYSDHEYLNNGIQVVEDISHCDIFLGVKEVKIESLVPGKTYLFFSHTIKKQPYNRGLLQKVIDKKIRLIDYECLVNEKGIRIIAFGRWAGIVGAYNALWTYGKKYDAYSLKRAFQCHNLNEVFDELAQNMLHRSFAIADDNMAIIFMPLLDKSWLYLAPYRFKQKENDEVSEVIWVNQTDFIKLVFGKQPQAMWRKVQAFLALHTTTHELISYLTRHYSQKKSIPIMMTPVTC